MRAFGLAGASLTELASFFAYDPAFTGGVFVAAGDVNNDGIDDIIAGSGSGGPGHVRGFCLVIGGTRHP